MTLTIETQPSVLIGNGRQRPTGPEAADTGESSPFRDVLDRQTESQSPGDPAAGEHIHLTRSGKLLQEGGKELPDQAIRIAGLDPSLISAPEIATAISENPVTTAVGQIATLPTLPADSADSAISAVSADSALQLSIDEAAPLPVDPFAAGLDDPGAIESLGASPVPVSSPAALPAAGAPLSPDVPLKMIDVPLVAGEALQEGVQSALGPLTDNAARDTAALAAATARSAGTAAIEGGADPTSDSEIRIDMLLEPVESVKTQELMQLKPQAVAQAAVQASPVAAGIAPAAGQVELPAALKTAEPGVVTTPLGDPGWSDEISGQITLMVKSGKSEANLQLNPAELGRLEIKISTDDDQAKVLFTVQNTAAREAIEQAIPRLKEMLEQSGLQLADSAVADHSGSQRHHAEAADAADLTVADFGQESQELAHKKIVLASDSTVDYYV